MKTRILIALIASVSLIEAATIDFDSAAYAIPSGQLTADANGVDGWEVSSGGTNSYLGFVVPSPGIGTSQALGFGPKWVLPEEASMNIKKDVNFALTGNETGVASLGNHATGTFTADIMVHRPNTAAGNDFYGVSLFGNAGNETISFTFDAGNPVSGLDGELGETFFNIHYNAQYQFKVEFTGTAGNFQTYAATLIDSDGGESHTKYGFLTSTEITSLGLTYALDDTSAALTTASDGYIIMDNAVFSTTIPEPSTSLLSLIGAGLLILRRRR
ncbi:MAG: PEP-CTERM sorting domain-containing protein [Verrucomicrobiota bacterium]|nr:PEP-CTERM sorting domain-containing protein [Verrucomicrobiota bacterium]MEE2808166.1 PEP-CTERM sorting domain-containing protein [Verrucomicrobiota bacterium]